MKTASLSTLNLIRKTQTFSGKNIDQGLSFEARGWIGDIQTLALILLSGT